MKPRNRRLRNLLPRIGLLVASPFVILVFAELLLHLTPSRIPYLHFAKPALYRADSELIYSFRASLDTTHSACVPGRSARPPVPGEAEARAMSARSASQEAEASPIP